MKCKCGGDFKSMLGQGDYIPHMVCIKCFNIKHETLSRPDPSRMTQERYIVALEKYVSAMDVDIKNLSDSVIRLNDLVSGALFLTENTTQILESLDYTSDKILGVLSAIRVFEAKAKEQTNGR